MKGRAGCRLQTFLNPLKQATAEPSHHTFEWPPGPVLVAATCGLLYSLCQGGPQTEHRWRLTLACMTLDIPEPVHSADSYTTLEHHLTTFTNYRRRWLLVRGHNQSYQLSEMGKSLPLIC